MSAFTESALTNKLLALNSSQQSIQTLSLWLIHHRKHSQVVVKTWFRQLQKGISKEHIERKHKVIFLIISAPENKKLTFLYLANDVIQNSKKKGPEYGREFFNVLKSVFKYIGEECHTDEKLFKSLKRILLIWEERGVYDKATISDYRSRLNREKEAEEEGVSGGSASDSAKVEKKRKAEDDSSSHRSSSSSSNNKKPKSNDSAKTPVDGAKLNGTPVESSVSLSPHVPLGDPPEPEELIEVLSKLMDNSAASDVVVREQIANFPKEISDLSFVAKLEDKEQAKKFSEKVRFFLRFHFGLIKHVERGFLTLVCCHFSSLIYPSSVFLSSGLDFYFKKCLVSSVTLTCSSPFNFIIQINWSADFKLLSSSLVLLNPLDVHDYFHATILQEYPHISHTFQKLLPSMAM